MAVLFSCDLSLLRSSQILEAELWRKRKKEARVCPLVFLSFLFLFSFRMFLRSFFYCFFFLFTVSQENINPPFFVFPKKKNQLRHTHNNTHTQKKILTLKNNNQSACSIESWKRLPVTTLKQRDAKQSSVSQSESRKIIGEKPGGGWGVILRVWEESSVVTVTHHYGIVCERFQWTCNLY